MKRSLRLCTINGVVIKMHWTFLIILVWVLTVNLINGYVPEKTIWSFVFILLICLSVAMHELVKYWVALHFKIKVNEIILLPTGGVSSFETFPDNFKKETLISIAGPLTNLAIAGLLLPFIQDHEPFWKVRDHFAVIYGNAFLYKLHLLNLWLFAINLVPAFPLAGGRIWRSLLGLKMNYFKATGIVINISKVFASAFLLAGILDAFLLPEEMFVNILLLVICILIFGAVQTEEYKFHIWSLIKGINFGEVVVNDYSSLQSNNTVKEVMGILMANHSSHFLVMEDGKPIGTIHRMQIINAASEKNYTLPVKSLMERNLVYFDAEANVGQEFKMLMEFPYRYYPVMQNNLFVGVASLVYVLEYLMLHRLTPKEHERLKVLINKI
jgi:Zn-dependent protease/predicted transcriptional regulator